MSNEIIDWESLIDICGDEDMIADVMGATVDDAKQTLTLLRDAVEAEDIQNTELYAHRLKGVSMVMGAATLTPLAHALEQATSAGRMHEVPSLFASIQETFDQVIAFLSQDNWMELAKPVDACQL